MSLIKVWLLVSLCFLLCFLWCSKSHNLPSVNSFTLILKTVDSLTYVVFVRVVECINDRRLGGPFVLVDGFPQFSHVSVGLKAQDGEEVDEELLGSDG